MNERPDIEIIGRLATIGGIAYGSMLSNMADTQRREDAYRAAAIRRAGAAGRAVMRSQHNRRVMAAQDAIDHRMTIALIELELARAS